MPLGVLHLVGSAESDFLADLSRLYAADCLQTNADPDLYRPTIAYVSPDGTWRFPAGLGEEELAEAPSVASADAVALLGELDLDVALPQMFCLAGMTHYRALLDLLGIPYVGNRPETMALAADKARAKAAVAAAGVDVPGGEILGPGDESTAAPPVVVKPLDSDNSLGISLVRDAVELPAALAAAREHSDRVLVEDYVELGREVRCGIVEVDGELRPLPLEEYAVDARRPIRLREDKISGRPLARPTGQRTTAPQEGGLSLVAKGGRGAWILPTADPLTAPVWEVAERCHRALDCRHHSLFDFRIDPSGRPWFLEAGLYCSFARQSVIATMARAAGISTEALLAVSIAEATSPARAEALG